MLATFPVAASYLRCHRYELQTFHKIMVKHIYKFCYLVKTKGGNKMQFMEIKERRK